MSGIFAATEEDSRVLKQISTALKIGGRCLFQFYNKLFAIHHGFEDRYLYNQSEAVFILDQAHHELPIKRKKLYSWEEWRQMLAAAGMRTIKEVSSRLPGDPQDGSARVKPGYKSEGERPEGPVAGPGQALHLTCLHSHVSIKKGAALLSKESIPFNLEHCTAYIPGALSERQSDDITCR